MLGIAVWMALAILILALLTIPLRLEVRLIGQGWAGGMTVRAHLLWFRIERRFDVSGRARQAVNHMIKRWLTTGELAVAGLLDSLRQGPYRAMRDAALPPALWLVRHMRCRQYQVQIRIGTGDAMQAALLSGACWTVIGVLTAFLSHWVRMPSDVQQVAVTPEFGRAAFVLQGVCIVEVRLGHAMLAMTRIAIRSLGNREIRAWLRDSQRRKGVE